MLNVSITSAARGQERDGNDDSKRSLSADYKHQKSSLSLHSTQQHSKSKLDKAEIESKKMFYSIQRKVFKTTEGFGSIIDKAQRGILN